MVVLRFKEPGGREFKVPLNIRVGRFEVPLGIGLIFLVLFFAAVVNFLTKEVATIGGVIFTAALFLALHGLRAHPRAPHREGAPITTSTSSSSTRRRAEEVSPAALGLTKPYRKLVAIRSPQNLFMLEKCLAETDPDTTDVVVMTANA